MNKISKKNMISSNFLSRIYINKKMKLFKIYVSKDFLKLDFLKFLISLYFETLINILFI
jgi:hypothetical protein